MNTEYSFAHYLGMEAETDATNYYTIINMATATDNAAEITPSDSDFAEGREYAVHMTDSNEESFTMNFASDVELDFEMGPNGEFVIVATDVYGNSVRIIIDGAWTGQVSINGGQITADDFTNIGNLGFGFTVAGTTYAGFYWNDEYLSHDDF